MSVQLRQPMRRSVPKLCRSSVSFFFKGFPAESMTRGTSHISVSTEPAFDDMNERVEAILLEKPTACPCDGHVHGHPLVSSDAAVTQSCGTSWPDTGPEGEACASPGSQHARTVQEQVFEVVLLFLQDDNLVSCARQCQCQNTNTAITVTLRPPRENEVITGPGPRNLSSFAMEADGVRTCSMIADQREVVFCISGSFRNAVQEV